MNTYFACYVCHSYYIPYTYNLVSWRINAIKIIRKIKICLWLIYVFIEKKPICGPTGQICVVRGSSGFPSVFSLFKIVIKHE